MKSTGLFGKNSGRVGGVVYSNYRGQQIVKSYQPQVKNPNSKGQIAQRAKFKLVSQVGASLGSEIAKAFEPNVATETPRNAWVRRMLKKAVFSNGQATIPLEDLVLTSGNYGTLNIAPDSNNATSPIQVTYYAPEAPENNTNQLLEVKGRVMLVAYNVAGQLVNFGTKNFVLHQVDMAANEYTQNVQLAQPEYFPVLQNEPIGYSNFRALFYVYEPTEEVKSQYADYDLTASEATLDVLRRTFKGGVMFSETVNIGLVAPV